MAKHRFFNMYLTTTISVALVLFLVGIECVVLISANDLIRQVKENVALTLVINDNFTYHYYSDFRSSDAKKQCREWMQKKSQLEKLQGQLETLRNQYASANESRRRSMKSQIIDLERQSEKLFAEVHEAEKKTRNLELK